VTGLQAGQLGFNSQKGRAEIFLFPTASRPTLGAHPDSHPVGTGGSFPRSKVARHEADHLPPSSANVKSVWGYTFIPPYISMVW